METGLLETSFWFVVVAMLWGATNPFIKRGSAGVESITGSNRFTVAIKSALYLLTRWQYVVPLGINLCGSTVYYYTLGHAQLSLAVPITNFLTFVFTALAGQLLGERIERPAEAYAGMALVVLGVALCVSASLEAH